MSNEAKSYFILNYVTRFETQNVLAYVEDFNEAATSLQFDTSTVLSMSKYV